MKMKNLKKALAFTGVLAFLGAGTVFAQDADTDETADETAVAPVAAPAPAPSSAGLDVAGGKLKIGAYINTGVEFDKDDSGTTVKPYGQDANRSGRVQVDLGWTSGDSTFGANIRFRADDIFKDLASGTPLSPLLSNQFFPFYAYGWYKPIQYLSVSGGIVDDGAFTTQGDFAKNALSSNFASSAGGLLHILPLDILDLGFGVFAPKDKGPDEAGPNTVYYAGAAVKTKPLDLRASAAIKDKLNNVLFSIGTGAIDNLSLALEGRIFEYTNADNNDAYGFWGDLDADYSLGDLGISLLAYYYNNDWKKGNTAYSDWYNGVYKASSSDILDITVQPGVSYALLGGKVVPGFKFLVGYGKDTEKTKNSLFRIQPQILVDFPVGKGRIEAGYQLTNDSVSNDGTKVDSLSGTSHAIYLDFLFKY